MSRENPAFKGIVDAIEQGGCYGFINNYGLSNRPSPNAGFGASINEPIFVHYLAVGHFLKKGMRIAFDTRPSQKEKHKGKLEAWNIVELYDAPTIA